MKRAKRASEASEVSEASEPSGASVERAPRERLRERDGRLESASRGCRGVIGRSRALRSLERVNCAPTKAGTKNLNAQLITTSARIHTTYGALIKYDAPSRHTYIQAR